MEKTTKKKKSKRLRRRIGLIAVGGLSLVLTVCLSVGATLAWFAGSTWASNDLYMGGPVYVEMAGRGHSGSTTGTGTNEGKWVGGDGKLDIVASARTTGTAGAGKSGYSPTNKHNNTADSKYSTTNVLLPGQKLLIYSQARVFSTAYYNNLVDGNYANTSSGANTTNISNGTTKYTNAKGVKKTTTTSVLRAKFSINVEFDPTVGINNFTNPAFAEGYPVKSEAYTGEGNKYSAYSSTSGFTVSGQSMTWDSALGASGLTATQESGYTKTYTIKIDGSDTNLMTLNVYTGRRDAVANPETTHFASDKDGKETAAKAKTWVDGSGNTDADTAARWDIKKGNSKSIYKWKYVDKSEYDANESAQMGAPFNGNYNTLGGKSKKGGGTGNGYYGLWVVDASGNKLESEAFYKARCSAYLSSYQEHYMNEYGNEVIINLSKQLSLFEDALNKAFEDLVNQSSDNILAGNINGFTADDSGKIDYKSGGSATSATWLYVDPTIGQDTNASDSATSIGGWWYLCESNTDKVRDGKNQVTTIIDNVVDADDNASGATTYSGGTVTYIYNETTNKNGVKNKPIVSSEDSPNKTIVRKEIADEQPSGFSADGLNLVANNDVQILNAKLFEIVPGQGSTVVEEIGYGNGTYKVVSVSFPFVNGNFEVPGKELGNNFANAKISFQITFQALQAFFPFTPSIDGCESGSPLAGTGKALNIANSIPIFNEAFDYINSFTK